jgi:hypothetical protein
MLRQIVGTGAPIAFESNRSYGWHIAQLNSDDQDRQDANQGMTDQLWKAPCQWGWFSS